ncbi:alcohol dehydrogenase catalytic domain-containing protein [Streptomyces sp. NPDC090085]|uniref:alcohol dehydrogenase catalytic domain-containing protein n=1 Tax=Streptomyces sp. NPDC090085 TaxID=3365943 RepID=UPI00382550DE
MRVLVAGGRSSAPPSGCEQVAEAEVRGAQVRFGVVERPDTAFAPDADHNREYVLVAVRVFSFSEGDLASLATGSPAPRWTEFGSDYVADVVAVGSAVTTLSPGDRVIPVLQWPPVRPDPVSAVEPPSTASRPLQRVHQARLHRLPSGIEDAEGTCLPTAAVTAYAMVRRAAVQPGETVLVTGACSPTSLALIQAARQHGALVYALAQGAGETALLEGLGVIRSFSPGEGDAVAAVAKRLRGFDIVLDPQWHACLPTAARLIGFSGRYVAGYSPWGAEDAAADWPTAAASLVAKNAVFIGQRLGDPADLAAAVADCGVGRLRLTVGSRFRGADIAPFVSKSLDPHRTGGVTYAFTEE